MDGLLISTSHPDVQAISSAFNKLAGAANAVPSDSTTPHSADPQNETSDETSDDAPTPTLSAPPVRIVLDARHARTLRVIKEIPANPLTQLEGRNGIGKSLAARLLELVSGTQPYSALPHAWKTLKKQLGRTTITVTGLTAGHLKIDLLPIEWPDDPVEALGDALGTVTLNDAPIDWQQARRLLQVARISGDESLVDAVARALEERAQWALRWRASIKGAVETWDTPLLSVQEILESLSHADFEAKLRDAATSKDVADELSKVASKVRLEVGLASQGQNQLDLAKQRRDQVPQLIEELASSIEDLGQIRASQKLVEQKLLAVSSALGLDGATRAEVDRWEHRRRLRIRAHQRARSDEDWYLAQLGDEDRPSWEDLSRRMKQAASQRREAKSELVELDLTDEVRQLGFRVEAPLIHAASTVLRQVIALTDEGLTGKALLDGLRRRRQEIDGRPTTAEVRAAKDRLDTAEHTERLLQSLSSAMATTDHKRDNVRQAESTLRDLLNQLQGNSQEVYEEVLDQLRKLQEDAAQLLQHRDAIRLRLAGLLNVNVPETDEPDSSPNEPNEFGDEDEDDEGAAGEETWVDDVGGADQDHLDLPLNADEWVQIWNTVVAGEVEELSKLGYEFSPEILFQPTSEGDVDELAMALDMARAKAEESSQREREITEQETEALEKLGIQQTVLAQARNRLRTSALMLVGPGTAWRPWEPGFLTLLETVGGTRPRWKHLTP